MHTDTLSEQVKTAARERRCRIVERVATAFLAVAVLLLAFEPRSSSVIVEAGKKAVGLAQQADECDAYDLPGVLRFDYANHSANYWEPALSPCQVRDYMTPLAFSDVAVPELEFMRGRVVAFFGDSVDRLCAFVSSLLPLSRASPADPPLFFETRSALVHFCDFFGGEVETVWRDHPLMPALPQGREHAPEGCEFFRLASSSPPSVRSADRHPEHRPLAPEHDRLARQRDGRAAHLPPGAVRLPPRQRVPVRPVSRRRALDAAPPLPAAW